MTQEFEKYTAEDFEVWKILATRQLENLQDKACSEYLVALKEIGFTPESIPDFKEVNVLLEKKNGWNIEVVPGLIEVDKFYKLLQDRKFCSSTWLRSMENLDYLEEPDMFHDTFGHLPLLMNPLFSEFTKGLGDLGCQFIDVPEVVIELQRLYWFTIEFGVIRQNGERRIYGAGILSSSGESNFAVSDQPTVMDFDIEKVIQTEFRTDVIQDKYFEIESFEQLNESLEVLARKYEERYVGVKVS